MSGLPLGLAHPRAAPAARFVRHARPAQKRQSRPAQALTALLQRTAPAPHGGLNASAMQADSETSSPACHGSTRSGPPVAAPHQWPRLRRRSGRGFQDCPGSGSPEARGYCSRASCSRVSIEHPRLTGSPFASLRAGPEKPAARRLSTSGYVHDQAGVGDARVRRDAGCAAPGSRKKAVGRLSRHFPQGAPQQAVPPSLRNIA